MTEEWSGIKPALRIVSCEALSAATGIVFVCLIVLTQVTTFATAEPPDVDAPTSEIREYLVHERSGILLAYALGGLAALFFIWFLGTLTGYLRRAEGTNAVLVRIAFGAGLVT